MDHDRTANASHPYRPHDAVGQLDPEIDRCLRWYHARWRRNWLFGLGIQIAAIVGCIALARLHWTGWILFGLIAFYVAVVNVVSVVSLSLATRFARRLRGAPEQLVWLHVETQLSDDKSCACELGLRDGTSSQFYLPVEMAVALAERASQWPFRVTRTQEARTAYETERQMHGIAERLQRAESPLAAHLAPHLLPVIEHASCADLAAAKVSALKAALGELDTLLSAAVEYDAMRGRMQRKVGPKGIAVWDAINPYPPYSERATTFVHAIRKVFADR